jgi:polysaccharide export outer membrane protein
VRPDGKITLPLIGDIIALGKFPEQLDNEISQSYRNLGVSTNHDEDNGYKEYHISVTDELEIKFPYHPGMDQTVKVRPDGQISLSLINAIKAEGKTPEELGHELNRRYQKFLKNPNLTVIVKQFSTMRYALNGKSGLAGLDNIKATVTVKGFEPLEVFVSGDVDHPGVISYRHTLTAMAAIAQAGGEKLGAEMSSVVLLRKQDKHPLAVKLNLSNEKNPEQPSNDVFLKPFDIIIVPRSKISEMGDFVDEIGRIVPPIKNSSFAFFYDVGSAIGLGAASTTISK